MNNKLAHYFLAAAAAGLMLLSLSSCMPVRETAGLPVTPPESAEAEALRRLEMAQSGEGAEAEAMLRELAARSDALGYAASVLLAERMPPQEAETYLRSALELHNNNDVRFALAENLAENGDRDAAIAEYLLLVPDERAITALQILEAGTLQLVAALADGSHWQAAATFLEALETDNQLPDELRLYYGRSLVALGRYREALPVLQELAGRLPEDLLVTWNLARALEGVGQTKRAMKLYGQSGPAGAYRLGRLHEQAGNLVRAAEAYLKSDEAAALWRGAVLLDESGNRQGALKVYRKLSAQPGLYQDDAAYRAGMILAADGEPQDEELSALIGASPAWAARMGSEPAWPEVSEPDTDAVSITGRLAAYRAAGRNDLEEVELAIAWQTSPAEERIALGEWFRDQGDEQQAVRWGARALRNLPARRAYLLAYPKPFQQEVKEAAAEFNLDPELIWAVMREESRYRPEVVSRVGAIGLMQIMPATGKEIAAAMQTGFRDRDLYQPSVNIRFGAYYLRKMLDRFNGDTDKALAAYNGGPGNVKRWSRSPLARRPAGFPTAISFLETREYITKVQNSYLTYQWLYRNDR